LKREGKAAPKLRDGWRICDLFSIQPSLTSGYKRFPLPYLSAASWKKKGRKNRLTAGRVSFFFSFPGVAVREKEKKIHGLQPFNRCYSIFISAVEQRLFELRSETTSV